MSRGGLLDYFIPSPEFRTQEKQHEAWEIAAKAELPARWLYELFTGYGKTLAAYGTYWILKKRGLVDRMLVLVPTDNQRKQFANESADARNLLGIDCRPWIITKSDADLRAIQGGKYDVVVATYQQLREDSFFPELLRYGAHSWMLTADECHHLGDGQVWGRRAMDIPNVVVHLGLSATPRRSDGQGLMGIPSHPTVRADYKQALEEKVVKRVIAKIDHYFLDVDIDGSCRRLTTESLLADLGLSTSNGDSPSSPEAANFDFSRYEAKRQLRYNRNYLNHMLLDPINELCQRLHRHPGQHQMIVFAMSCRHAHYVSDQINSLAMQLGLPVRSNWIGVGEGLDGTMKSAEENEKLIKAYEDNEFQIIVQVAKLREGFSVKRVSLAVFLHLIGADPAIIQQIGRAVRRNPAIPFEEDTAIVYASADTPIADIVKNMAAVAEDVDPEGGTGPGEGPERWPTIPDLILIDSYYDRCDFVAPDGVPTLDPAALAFCERFGIPHGEYLVHFGTSRAHTASAAPTPGPTPNSRDQLRMAQDQVNSATSTLCGGIMRVRESNGLPFDRNLLGPIKKQINGEWKRVSGLKHGEMLPDEFRRKHAWLKAVYEQVRQTKEVPSWCKL